MRKMYRMAVLMAGLFLAGGCAAIQTGIQYRNLETSTKMSSTVFLDPISPNKRTVWIDLKNTSDQQLDLGKVGAMLASRSIQVVSDPMNAHYRLQGNILHVGKTSVTAAERTLLSGYGGALVGMGAGAAIGAASGSIPGIYSGMIGGAVVGGLAEMVANSLVAAVTYVVVADIQLSEYSEKPINQRETGNMNQGDSARVYQSQQGEGRWKRYRTRVVATAVKVNLEFGEARPALEDNLARSIAGMF